MAAFMGRPRESPILQPGERITSEYMDLNGGFRRACGYDPPTHDDIVPPPFNPPSPPKDPEPEGGDRGSPRDDRFHYFMSLRLEQMRERILETVGLASGLVVEASSSGGGTSSSSSASTTTGDTGAGTASRTGSGAGTSSGMESSTATGTSSSSGTASGSGSGSGYGDASGEGSASGSRSGDRTGSAMDTGSGMDTGSAMDTGSGSSAAETGGSGSGSSSSSSTSGEGSSEVSGEGSGSGSSEGSGSGSGSASASGSGSASASASGNNSSDEAGEDIAMSSVSQKTPSPSTLRYLTIEALLDERTRIEPGERILIIGYINRPPSYLSSSRSYRSDDSGDDPEATLYPTRWIDQDEVNITLTDATGSIYLRHSPEVYGLPKGLCLGIIGCLTSPPPNIGRTVSEFRAYEFVHPKYRYSPKGLVEREKYIVITSGLGISERTVTEFNYSRIIDYLNGELEPERHSSNGSDDSWPSCSSLSSEGETPPTAQDIPISSLPSAHKPGTLAKKRADDDMAIGYTDYCLAEEAASRQQQEQPKQSVSRRARTKARPQRITRFIIAGNYTARAHRSVGRRSLQYRTSASSASTSQRRSSCQLSSYGHEQLSEALESEHISAMALVDDFVCDMAYVLPVDMMPGAADITCGPFPQRPLGSRIVPRSAEIPNVNLTTNPFMATVDGVKVLGTSGQNVRFIREFTDLVDSVEILEKLLQWGHMSPTSPCFEQDYVNPAMDPFIIDELPSIFFVGNQRNFATKLAKIGSGYVRLISVPDFKTSHCLVRVNLKTLDTKLVDLDMAFKT